MSLLGRAQGSLGGSHAGELHRQGADAKAKRILAEELERRGWGEDGGHQNRSRAMLRRS